MTVIRELVTALGWKVDTSGYQKAETQYKRLKTAAGGTSAANRAAGASVGRAGRRASVAGRQFAKAGTAVQKTGRQARVASTGLRKVGDSADKAGRKLAKTEKKVITLQGALTGLGGVLAGSMIARGLSEIVEMASSANEDTNVLEAVFGSEGRADVDAWAATIGSAMGRSRYAMRNSAAGIGAIVEKMTDTPEAALAMSKSLAGLAVDLGSFYNTTDDIALTALKSGITGELEPLKKFGIVMTEAALKAFAMDQGIRGNVQSMSIREKTALRYQFILANTTKAQGDAAKTADGYANASKGMRAALTDVGIAIGMGALPMVERLVQNVRDGARSFADWTKDTKILEAGMLVLGGVGAAGALKMIAPYGKAIAKFGLWGLAIGAVALVLDDLHAAYTGGTSVVGHYIDKVFGIGTTAQIVADHKAGIESIGQSWETSSEAAGRAFTLFGADVANTLAWAVYSFEQFGADVTKHFEAAKSSLMSFGADAAGAMEAAKGAFSAFGTDAQAALDTAKGAFSRFFDSIRTGWNKLPAWLRVPLEAAFQAKVTEVKGDVAGIRSTVSQGREIASHAFEKMSGQAVPAGASLQSLSAPRSAPESRAVTVGGVTVNVNGPVRREDVSHIKRELERAGDRDRRRTESALQRLGG